MAFTNDAKHFLINRFCGFFAKGLTPAESSGEGRVQIGIVFGSKLNHAKAVTHAPSRHHTACDVCGLLDVVFCARGSRTVDNLLCGTASQYANNARPQV